MDTSVWIELFRHHTRLELESIIDLDEAVTCLPVIQEVLQGFDNQAALTRARRAMLAFPIVEAPLTADTLDLAVDLYRSARRSGGTVRSSTDCLIAACAIRSSLPTLHNDRDFDAIAGIAPLDVQTI